MTEHTCSWNAQNNDDSLLDSLGIREKIFGGSHCVHDILHMFISNTIHFPKPRKGIA
jgi:hypothetical protein